MSSKSLDVDDPQQPYQQVASRLRDAITSGKVAVGEQVGSVRTLAKEYGVSGGTVQQALRVLRQEGLVTTWQGRGTFVRSRRPPDEDAGDADIEAVMQRLDEILDRIEQLESQVAVLEQTRKSR